MDTIHIVEPTLISEAGHCYSFVNSLCQASYGVNLNLWVNHQAKLFFTGKNIYLRRHFYRRIRRLQNYFLYRKLLRSPDKIFISTATTSDLMLLGWAATKEIQDKKAYLYFHWLNMNEKKLSYLKRLAQVQPNIIILGPTPSVINVFTEAGFQNAHIVPYPLASRNQSGTAQHEEFSALLYAGAARQDKGISHIVDLLQHMKNSQSEISFRLQNSANHHGEYNEATKADMRRLGEINYPHLQCFPDTLNTEEYVKLFAGAICLQLYDSKIFADRISGVTLDALLAGSPIITTADSWIARKVQRFNAGAIVNEPTPEKVLSAVKEIMSDYAQYQKNAYVGGLALQQENSADVLFKAITDKSP